MSWRLAGDHYGGGAGPPGPPGPAGPGGTGISIQPQLINDSGAIMHVGQIVYSSSAGKMKLAKADAAATALAIAMVTDPTIAIGVTGNAQAFGLVTLTTAQWDARTGDVGGLVEGKQYWASIATAGNYAKDPAPVASGSFDTLIGLALSTTQMLLQLPVQPIGPNP